MESEGPALSTGRLEAFSDGVFAVAITLLVLNLTVPEVASGGLWNGLQKEWPRFASYVVSFLVIGIIWVNHHGLFRQIVRVDRILLFFNLILLMSVVLIPFSTGLLARYITAGANSHVAAAIYSATMLWMALSFSLIWSRAVLIRGLLAVPVPRGQARTAILRFGVVGTVAYVATVGVAFISAVACLALHFMLALYYVFDQTGTSAVAGKQTEASEELP